MSSRGGQSIGSDKMVQSLIGNGESGLDIWRMSINDFSMSGFQSIWYGYKQIQKTKGLSCFKITTFSTRKKLKE